MKFTSLATLLVVLGWAVSAQGAIITYSFTDGTFADADWAETTIGSGSQTVTQESSGGNPDAFRKVVTDSGALVYTVHINSAFLVDPSATPIVSIDFSIDYKNIDSRQAGQSLQLGLVQDGTAYYGAAYTTTGDDEGTWFTHAASELTASDFTPVGGGSGTPDFSKMGDPINFGFITDNSSGGGISVGYDNYDAEVNAAPEPASLAIWGALSALGLAGAWRRRKAA